MSHRALSVADVTPQPLSGLSPGRWSLMNPVAACMWGALAVAGGAGLPACSDSAGAGGGDAAATSDGADVAEATTADADETVEDVTADAEGEASGEVTEAEAIDEVLVETEIEPPVDTTAPTPGAALTFTQVGAHGLTANWGAASDDVSSAETLRYRLIAGPTLESIDTLAEAVAVDGAGILMDFTANVSSHALTELDSSSAYVLAVVVADEAGNMALYAPQTATTRDVTPPRAGSAITFSNIAPTGVSLAWGAATDDVTDAGTLAYKVVSGTLAGNIDTLAEVDAITSGPGLVMNFTAGVTSLDVASLQASSAYAFAVVVRDAAGNEDLYPPATVETLEGTAPTIGGALSASDVTATSLRLAWGAATDNETASADLVYKIVRAASAAEIDSLLEADAITGGDALVSDFVADTTEFDVTGLTSSTTYAFAVVVADAAGNEALYAPTKVSTLDVTAPETGAGITFGSVTPTSLTVQWGLASDDVTAQALLEYKVVMAGTSEAIDSLTEVDAITSGAGLVTDFTPNETSADVSDLTSSTRYAFAVVVKDASGNEALYPAAFGATQDITPPTSGAAISFGAITATSIRVAWGAANDDVTPAGSLVYKVVKAPTAAAIDTLTEVAAITDGPGLVAAVTDTFVDVTSLTSSTPYAFAVVVSDAAGNQAFYAPAATETLDVTNPTVGAPITFSAISANGLNVRWGAAADDKNPPALLQYRLVAAPTESELDTLAEALAVQGSGIAMDWTANTTFKTVTGLTSSTAYAFAVLVRDQAGNAALYAPKVVSTLDVSAPTPGDDIAFENIAPDALTVTWGAAADDLTAALDLRYKVVRANDAALIDTVAEADAIAGGVGLVMDYAPNVTEVAVANLTSSTTYAFAVVVIDADNNRALYSPRTVATADITAPVVGNAIDFEDVRPTAVTVVWGAATDEFTLRPHLEYKLVAAASDDAIDTLAEVGAITSGPGLVRDFAAGATSFVVVGLQVSTSYAFAVVVRDEAGNEALYAPAVVQTLEGIPPAVGAALTASAVTATGLTLTWGAATDNDTATSALAYKVVKAAQAEAIDSLAEVRAITGGPDLVLDFVADTTQHDVTGLASSTTYAFAVAVRDAAGNEALYAPTTVSTLDITAPRVGLGLTFADITPTSMTVQWGLAADDVTAQGLLEYKVVMATTSAAIDTLAEVDAITGGAGLVLDFLPNETSVEASNLTSSTRYAFAVVVRDAAGNEALYPVATKATLDVTPPIAGAAVALGAITANSMRVQWGAASDDVTPATSLSYKLVKAPEATDIDTLAEVAAITEGPGFVGTYATTFADVTGLASSTHYAFAVVVADGAGNEALYAPASAYTLDVTQPTVGTAVTFSAISANGMNVRWGAAADDRTPAGLLQYRLLVAANESQLDTLAEANAIQGAGVAMDWSADTTVKTVTGLNSSTSYAFAVLVRDQAGNASLYAPKTVSTLDVSAPTLGTGIVFENVDAHALTVRWGAASDNITAAVDLRYKVVRAASIGEIDTVAEADAIVGGVGLVMDYAPNVTQVDATSLSSSTTYAFAVLVVDADDNTALYSPRTVSTTDVTAPIAGAAIGFAAVHATNVTVTWGAASDEFTPPSGLQYKLVMAGSSAAIDSLAEVDAITGGGGLVMDWSPNATTRVVNGLTELTTYAFAVAVRDAAGNKALYAPATVTTRDGTPPSVGAALGFSGATATAVTVSWGAASDNVTPTPSLQYKLVRAATVQAIDTIDEVEAIAGAALVQNWTAALTTKTATGLAEYTSYAFAVAVRDEAGNLSLYAPKSVTTSDGTPPAIGANITFANVTASGLTVNWGAANDNVTAATALEYKLVRATTSAGVADVASADAVTGADVLIDWTANTTSKAVSGLAAGDHRFYAVLVRDAAGMKALYAPRSRVAGKMIYVSAALFNGNLGGVAGADAKCGSNRPDNADTSATVKALIGVGNIRRACTTANCGGLIGENGPVDWVLAASTSYFNVGGALIAATNTKRLLDFPFAHAVTSANSAVATGLATNWVNATANCTGFTDTSGGALAYGDSSATTSGFLNAQSTTCPATTSTVPLALVCVEQ